MRWSGRVETASTAASLALAACAALWYRWAARAALRRYQAAEAQRMRRADVNSRTTDSPLESRFSQNEDANPASLTERWTV